MVEERKNATKTVTCQIDDLRHVACNLICLVSAGLKIHLPELYPLLKISRIWRCATLLMRQPPRNSSYYLISTFAPAASTFFLISSASCLVTPSLIVLGAPSTSAFASARPRPGTALRTSLITAILFAPISVRITSNVVFSSTAGAAAPAAAPRPGPAATATGAAALTPHFSSSCLTNPAISRTERLLSSSTILSVSAILVFPPVAASESLRRIKVGSHQLGQFRLCWNLCDRQMPAVQNSCRGRALLFSLRAQQSRECRGWLIEKTH